MPELPEVEVVCRSLREILIARRITNFSVSLPKLLKIPANDTAYFAQNLIGKSFSAVKRRGKYILLELDEGLTLTVHLRMTGKLLYQASEVPLAKHCHIVLELDNGYDLRFDDVRQFGAFYLTKTEDLNTISGLNDLGIEPLEDAFTFEVFQNLIKNRTQKAKVFLLDQQYIAGIGNIYADEILFQAHIHPAETLDHIIDEEQQYQFWQAIREQLSAGIAMGGSSIKDYVDSLGHSGSYQDYHKVYGRFGKPCVNCQTPIEKIKLAGRSTCYCPNCQIRHKDT